MSTTRSGTITLQEFEALSSDEIERKEVVRGHIVPRDPLDEDGQVMFPGILHSTVQGTVGVSLLQWVKANNAGLAGMSLDCVLELSPLTMRIPDVVFLSKKTIGGRKIPHGAWHGAPDLAVEVISPYENRKYSDAKVADYLKAGSALVWTAWCDTSEVVAHTPDGVVRTYRLGDTLEFPEVLPGFSCLVDDLFPQEENE